MEESKAVQGRYGRFLEEKIILETYNISFGACFGHTVWQCGLWSFQAGDTKLALEHFGSDTQTPAFIVREPSQITFAFRGG